MRSDADGFAHDHRQPGAGRQHRRPTHDPPYRNQTTTFEATQTGGSAPYTYAWDTDNDGAFDDATTRVTTRIFTELGPRTVKVRIRDAATPLHETIVTRTFEVVEAPPDATPTPTPAPCIQDLTFALSQFTTEGCFTNVSAQPEQWETTAAIKLNGVVFPDFGQTFTITKPTTAEPGGHFKALDASVQLGELTAYSGDIDWTLPAGNQGEEGVAATFAVPPLAELFRLRVRGSTELRLGLRRRRRALRGLPVQRRAAGDLQAGAGPRARRA